MPRNCEICGKGTMYGNNVSHSHKKTRRNWKINLVSLKTLIDGKKKKIKICTRCLRTGKYPKVI